MRRITADRDRLNLRQNITIDPDGYVYAGGLKICQFEAATGTLRFVARRADRTEKRMVEVELLDFVRGLVGDR